MNCERSQAAGRILKFEAAVRGANRAWHRQASKEGRHRSRGRAVVGRSKAADVNWGKWGRVAAFRPAPEGFAADGKHPARLDLRWCLSEGKDVEGARGGIPPW